MKHVRVFGVPVLGLALLMWPQMTFAQATKTARGTVTGVSGRSITVHAGGSDMKFNADSDTMVIAAGAGTKARRAAAEGQPGPKLVDLVKTGQAVIVTYRESGSGMNATQIQVVSSAGRNGGSVSADKPAAKTASGTVKSVSDRSLIVASTGADKTFVVDTHTQVVGTGAGTKSRAAGGKVSITELVAAGNTVSVTYDDGAGSARATLVRVVAGK